MKHIRSTFIVAGFLGALIAQHQVSDASYTISAERAAQINSNVLLTDVDSEVLHCIVRCDSRSAAKLSDAQLASQPVAKLLSIASHPSTHFVGRLYSFILSNDAKDIESLAAIAKTSTTPLSILNALATHESEAVRTALALNPALNASLAEKLLATESKSIRFALALNTRFAQISPSQAADFLIETASSKQVAAYIPASDIAALRAQNDYHSFSVNLLSTRSSMTSATEVAEQLVASLS